MRWLDSARIYWNYHNVGKPRGLGFWLFSGTVLAFTVIILAFCLATGNIMLCALGLGLALFTVYFMDVDKTYALLMGRLS